ncbi:hypothetical protein [Ottowia sp. oral taxon 894]|uniref:hypothetical protein n=1 Tax=Ottowia sp. oral taxon 894 TaxID=1658672 RepID=UPI00155DBCD4|nr:hypothetical protein [Ottowia sp. oral taxon 894]
MNGHAQLSPWRGFALLSIARRPSADCEKRYFDPAESAPVSILDGGLASMKCLFHSRSDTQGNYLKDGLRIFSFRLKTPAALVRESSEQARFPLFLTGAFRPFFM